MKKNFLIYLGIFLFIFWLGDSIDKIFLQKAPLRVLWYSSCILLITSIGLILKNRFLITSMFCATFVVEGFWNLGFIYTLLFHKSIGNMSVYAFQNGFSSREFFTTLYHLLMIPSILLGIYVIKIPHKKGWLGATVFAFIIAFSTYFLIDSKDNINCIQTVKYCQNFFSFFYILPNPQRIIAGIFFLSVFIYIPSNIILLKILSKKS